jgi:SSS family solute:Na+ symporter
LIAIVSVAALVPYLTVQITGAGLLFKAATHGQIPFWLGALAAFAVVTLYVYTSGLRGIGWTNVVQGIMMVIVAWVLGLAVAHEFYGGIGAMFHAIQASAAQYLTIPGGGYGMGWASFSTAILVSELGGLMWPHIFMRFYTADSDRTIKKIIVLYPLYAYLLVPILIIGFAGIFVYRDNPLGRSDDVLLALVTQAADFSPWLIGIMLSGALAAAMSTGFNLAHTAATVAARDLIGTLRPGIRDASMVRLTKVLVLFISVAAYILSLFNPASLVVLLLSAYGIIVQLMPLTAAVLFWRRATRAGALAELIAGSVVTLLFTFGPDTPFGIHAGIWGLLVNAIALVGVSFATQPMDSRHVNEFAAAMSEETDPVIRQRQPDIGGT